MRSWAPFDSATAMGRRMQAHDWASTPLGAPEQWPTGLRIAVRAMLASREPRSVSWGPSLSLLYNDAYAEMMDGRHPGALGRPLPEVWHEVWERIRPDVEAALGGDGTYRSSMPLARLEDGTLVHRWHTVAYTPVFGDDGEIGGVQCLTLNVTDRVSAQLLHERELKSLRDLFAAAPGFMAVLRGPDYVYELANDAYEALVGQRGLAGRSARTVLTALGSQGYFDLLDEVRLTARPFIGRAMPFRLAEDAAERFIDFVFQPILDDGTGQVDRIFVQGSDVTDREDALRALREESNGKDHFLALLGHELRNPLAPIATAGALLCAGCDDGRSRQLGDIVRRQAGQLGRIVDDLLDVSRVSRGSFHLDVARVELARVIQTAVEEVAELVERKSHRLVVRVPDGTVSVDGDAGRLTQAVTNLLTNACRYTPEGGALGIELSAQGSHACIVVRDDGMGIDPARLPRLFELFAPRPGDPARRDGGLGLGLTLVRRLAELHGGEVQAHSDGPGRGATFTMRLPLAAAGAPAGVPDEAVATPSA